LSGRKHTTYESIGKKDTSIGFKYTSNDYWPPKSGLSGTIYMIGVAFGITYMFVWKKPYHSSSNWKLPYEFLGWLE
jgi:hypothetical protein